MTGSQQLATRPAPALTRSRRAFLTAEWRNLCLFNYRVEPERLQPWLPPGLELDLRDGSAFVSLVAFDFLDTRVLGIPWPGYRNFPEINLRFYVREGQRRGVAFIRELVPKRAIAFFARWLYNEPYEYAPMTSRLSFPGQFPVAEHEVNYDRSLQRLRVETAGEPEMQAEDSEAHFFKEHQWGYGTSRSGQLLRYEVTHEHWLTRPVADYQIEFDFERVYGSAWAHLTSSQPDSVLFAEGSPIRVSPLQR